MASESWTDVKANHVLCVSGGSRRQWTPVPTVEVGGVAALSVSSREPWLCNHVFGKHTKEGYMTEAVKVVAERLRGQMHESVTEADVSNTTSPGVTPGVGTSPGVTPGDATSPGKKPKGARRLGIGDSDPVSPKRKQRPRTSTPPSGAKKRPRSFFSTASVNGTELLVKLKHGTGLHVVATPEAVKAIITAVREEYDSQLAALREPAAVAGGCVAGDGAQDVDKGRVRWNFARNSWQIHYDSTGQGQMKTSIVGLQVPTVASSGEALASEAYASVRSAALLKARTLWNHLDRSDSDRFSPGD